MDLSTGKLVSERISLRRSAIDSTEELFGTLTAAIARIPGQHAIGLAFPSVLRDGRIGTSANLNKAWIGQSLEKLAWRRLLRPIAAVNDTDIARVAQLRYGAARDERGTVLLLTLGAGIESALYVDGRLVPNTEFGHLIIGGVDADCRASEDAKVARNLSWSQWRSELDAVLKERHALLWPDLIVLCGGISVNPEQFLSLLHCDAKLCVGALRAEAGIIGAAAATLAGVMNWANRDGAIS